MDNNNFLKSLSRGLLDDVRKVMEGKTHTVPKTEKEKKLAALAEPKDKITHADVLKGRGVVKEEEQIDELSTSTLQSYRKKARAQGNAIVDKMKMGGGDWSKDQKDTKTLRKRAAGAQASGKQLVKRGESLKTEEVEDLEELSTKTLDSYRSKARNQIIAAKNKDTDTTEKRLKGYTQASKSIGKNFVKGVYEEAEDLDEALDAAARYGQHHTAVKELIKSISQHIENHKSDALKHRDYRGKKGVNWGHVGDIAHIHSQLADIHDRLAQQGEYKKEMAESVEDDSDVKFTAEELAFLEDCGLDLEEARRGRPPKNAAAAQDEEPAALGYQLRKAASINKPVHFMNGEKKEVAQGHINAFNDHMAARKTAADKAAFQKRAHKSHAEFVKAVSEKVPSSSKDTGEIVKYR